MGSLNGVISLGPWGGSGGDHWSFRANIGTTEIVIHEEVNIKSISFKDASGDVSGTFGGQNPNSRGQEKKIPIRWPSEYLKSISGTYGNYNGLLVIRSLSFITNFSTYGPFGTTSGGEPFSIPISDSVIVGFHGRAGYYLDALGIFVQPVASRGTISFGPWGGPAGDDAFSFRVQGSWIKEIIVHSNATVNAIAFKDANGHYYGKFGGKDPNDIGVEKTVELDGNLEYLTSISGTYGNYKGFQVITSLSFITNLNTYGPFGTASSTSFSMPMIHGSQVTGFHGRGGWYLDAIGIYVNPKDKDIGGTISLGPWGSPGGHYPWSYTTNEGITQINIYANTNLKAISFKDSRGVDSAKFGGNNPNDPGEMSTVNINWPSEYLKSISGTYGIFNGYMTITSLSIITNLATHGPFGDTYGTSFSVPTDNGMIVGFHGRYGWYLDALGIFVKPANTTAT